jgi:hypothetical protein
MEHAAQPRARFLCNLYSEYKISRAIYAQLVSGVSLP